MFSKFISTPIYIAKRQWQYCACPSWILGQFAPHKQNNNCWINAKYALRNAVLSERL